MLFCNTRELIQTLDQNHEGPLPAMLVTKCPAALIDGSPFENVTHYAYRAGKLGASYTSEVNAARAGEGLPTDFKSKGLWNGKGVRNSKYTVRHSRTGQVYFAFYPAQVPDGTPIGSSLVYDRDEYRDASGNVIPLEAITPFLAPVYKSKRQGLTHDVRWRVIKLENVVQVQTPDLLVHLPGGLLN